MLGSGASDVIAMRMAQGMTGTLSAAEAHRMIAEKQAAVAQACFAFTKRAERQVLFSISFRL